MAKAWEQVAAVGQRAFWEPRNVLVTGAGPIGLLAALIGKQRGLDVHVLDRVETGAKPDLVRALGATYHAGTVADVGFQPDVIVECTGVGQVIADAIRGVGRGRRRVPHGRRERRPRRRPADRGRRGRDGPPEQRHRREREREQAALVQGRGGARAADRAWLARLVTRRAKPEDFARALEREPDDIKVVVQFAEA